MEQNLPPSNLGKILIIVGLAIAILGLAVTLLSQMGLFKLPGDLQFGGKNFKIYVPIASCVVISLILTFILWVINYFSK